MFSQIKFCEPSVYRIVAQGRVSPGFSELFNSMRVQTGVSESGFGAVVLEGRVRDQAELMGILNALHEFHLSLTLVKKLDGRPDAVA